MATLKTNEIAHLLSDDNSFSKAVKLLETNHQLATTCSNRIATIVQSLKTFAQLDEAEFQITDLHEGIDSALTLLSSQLKNDISIVKRYSAMEPIYCAPGQLNQVFMHVLKNALAATEQGGTITILTSEDRDWVFVQISDTGEGIPPDQLERIFDLDFQVADRRIKMGFGLATDYRIIQEHQGEINVESLEGKGTTVTISLPKGQKKGRLITGPENDTEIAM